MKDEKDGSDVCRVRARVFGFGSRAVCGRKYTVKDRTECRNEICYVVWKLPREVTDRGRHGEGAKTYGWDGMGTWDGSKSEPL